MVISTQVREMGDQSQPADAEFEDAVAQVFNILNIGPSQGKVILSLLNLAYFRGKRDALVELKQTIEEIK